MAATETELEVIKKKTAAYVTALNKEMENLRAELAQAKTENAEFQLKLREEEELHKRTQEALATTRSQGGEALTALAQIGSSKDEDLSKLREQHAEEVAVLKRQMETWNEERETEREKVKNYVAQLKERAAAEIARLKGELASSHSTTTTGGNNNNNNNKESEQKISSLTAMLEEAKREKVRMEEELGKAETKISQLAEQAVQARLHEKGDTVAQQGELTELRVQAEDLKNELKGVKADAETKRVQTKAYVEKVRKEQLENEAKVKAAVDEKLAVENALSSALGEIKKLEQKVKLLSQPGGAAALAASSSSSAIPSSSKGGVAPPSSLTAELSEEHLSQQNKTLHEAKLVLESKLRAALEEAAKYKRDHSAAKREAISLAEALDRLKGSLSRATLQVKGSLGLATDRCSDALRSCEIQVEAAVSAIASRTGDEALLSSLGTGGERTTRGSSMGNDDEAGGAKAQGSEERLMQALAHVERRMDEVTSTLRFLLPKVKRVCQLAVEEKQPPPPPPSGFCDLRRILFGGGGKVEDGGGSAGRRATAATSQQQRKSSSSSTSRSPPQPGVSSKARNSGRVEPAVSADEDGNPEEDEEADEADAVIRGGRRSNSGVGAAAQAGLKTAPAKPSALSHKPGALSSAAAGSSREEDD